MAGPWTPGHLRGGGTLTLTLTLGHGQVVAVLLGLVAGHSKRRPLAAGNAEAESEVNL